MHKHQFPKTFAEGVARLSEEAAGLFRLELIRPTDHFAIAAAAFSGDRVALSRMRAVIQSAGIIERMAKDTPATCLCCPASVLDPFATLALTAPATASASVALCGAICPACSTGPRAEVLQRAAEAYRGQFPGLRCVEVTHPEGGRA